MKKVFLILLVLLGLQTRAQTSLTTAVDFTVTDVHGEIYNLFSILDSGKHVIIDFFFTTCPPCIASVPVLNQSFLKFLFTSIYNNNYFIYLIKITNINFLM